jgi:CubicO group peptidase (beta-lactamase class C family)
MNVTYSRRELLQRVGLGVAGAWAAGSLPVTARALMAGPLRLPRSAPGALGVASAGVLDFINGIEAGGLNLHSFMVLRHGQVAAEGWWAPYGPRLRHTLYSLSKSFTSTAIGFAVAEGTLQLGDTVVRHFPQELPAEISPHLTAMRINDLLMMGAGHVKDALLAPDFSPPEGDWIKAILAQPVEFAPGTHFTYNNAAPYLLSAILQKVTGQTLLAYLTPRLFEPLGIEGADWEVSPQGINTGGWGLRVKTEDIAKLGQLYLQKGRWNGKELLPAEWIDQATRSKLPTAVGADFTPARAAASDWAQGYGYQFWRCRLDGYRGDGAFGQFCIVMPKEYAVIAITSETADMQAVLNVVWRHLLPAIQGIGLTLEGKVNGELKEKLAGLALPLPIGMATSPTAARVSKHSYGFGENRPKVSSVSLEFQEGKCLFTMRDGEGEHQIACGIGRWVDGETDLSVIPLKLVPTAVPEETRTKIAGSGAWSDDDTFVMHWRFIETAHYERVTCRFEGDVVRIEFKRSLELVNPAMKDKRPLLTGKVKGS